jgi:hypothetical protein
MTNPNSNDCFVPLLPRLKVPNEVSSGRTGMWVNHPKTAFQNVATSLDYQSSGELRNVNSVPTVWARPLTMEMAVHNPGHPIRKQMVEQWQGMLAAIALAEIMSAPLTVKLLEVEKFKSHAFALALDKLLPNPEYSLYHHEEKTDKHPWKRIYVFYWDGKPIGMSTPSTFVVPSEEGNWSGLRWWTGGRLQAPQKFLNPEEQALLRQWLGNLQQELDPAKHQGNPAAIENMVRLIDEFKDSLHPNSELPFALSAETDFFGTHLNQGALQGLNRPIKAPDRPSCVCIVPSAEKKPAKNLILIDPELASKWGKRPEDIRIHKGKNLATLQVDDLRSRRLVWEDVRWVEAGGWQPNGVFLPELTFIEHFADLIPGAIPYIDLPPIMLAGEPVTLLMPINAVLTEYFTPAELNQRVRFTLDGVDKVKVTLDLPLSGMGESATPTNYRLSKTYELKRENALTTVPVLEVWPNLRSADWHDYYTFYYDLGLGRETFQAEFAHYKDSAVFKDSAGGNYQMLRLEQFPESIQCKGKDNQPVGLILLRQPEESYASSTWKVGVDFGTSFTNVYVNRAGNTSPLPLQTLHLKVTESESDTRTPTLFEYFVPESFIPSDKPLPLSSVLTTRGKDKRGETRPILDGRIYIPNNNRFFANAEWIETNLKWENFEDSESFLRHLMVHISALAVKEGVNEIRWFLSFPSAFSRKDRGRYADSWKKLTDELSPKTGVIYHCSDDFKSSHYKTESLAIAQYFADQEDRDLVYSTCIDMGGGTSDISIWEGNRLMHQCSVQLAGRNLLAQFLELKPQFIEKQFGKNINDWRDVKGSAFHAKLDVLLRWQSDEWLSKKRRTLDQDDEFQGLIRLTALGIAGLYYYVGILLKTLNDRGRYDRDRITPVYLGGNGSRLMNWLDSRGQFSRNSEINELLSRMLSRGSGFEDTQETTTLSQKPKDEVACGLVLDRTKLEIPDDLAERKFAEPVVTGEACEFNGKTLAWDDFLEFTGNVEGFRIPNFNRLAKFLYDFDEAMETLRIQDIRPLKNYKRSLDLSANPKIWDGTRRALDKLLQESKISGDSINIRVEPPFILCLKALLDYLGREWAGR